MWLLLQLCLQPKFKICLKLKKYINLNSVRNIFFAVHLFFKRPLFAEQTPDPCTLLSLNKLLLLLHFKDEAMIKCKNQQFFVTFTKYLLFLLNTTIDHQITSDWLLLRLLLHIAIQCLAICNLINSPYLKKFNNL